MIDFFGAFSIEASYIVIGLTAILLTVIILLIVFIVKTSKIKKKYESFMIGSDGKSIENIIKENIKDVQNSLPIYKGVSTKEEFLEIKKMDKKCSFFELKYDKENLTVEVIELKEITGQEFFDHIEEMEIYYTCNYATTDMAREGIPEKIEHRKAVLKPNTEGMYQIIRIEVIEEQASKAQMSEEQPQTEQMPEEKVPEEPAENVGFPAGNYSFATQTGGARSSLTIDSAGVATYVEFSSGTGKGSEIKYQMVVDGTAAVSDGVTAYWAPAGLY